MFLATACRKRCTRSVRCRQKNWRRLTHHWRSSFACNASACCCRQSCCSRRKARNSSGPARIKRMHRESAGVSRNTSGVSSGPASTLYVSLYVSSLCKVLLSTSRELPPSLAPSCFAGMPHLDNRLLGCRGSRKTPGDIRHKVMPSGTGIVGSGDGQGVARALSGQRRQRGGEGTYRHPIWAARVVAPRRIALPMAFSRGAHHRVFPTAQAGCEGRRPLR